jgi:hypothetical protein
MQIGPGCCCWWFFNRAWKVSVRRIFATIYWFQTRHDSTSEISQVQYNMDAENLHQKVMVTNGSNAYVHRMPSMDTWTWGQHRIWRNRGYVMVFRHSNILRTW